MRKNKKNGHRTRCYNTPAVRSEEEKEIFGYSDRIRYTRLSKSFRTRRSASPWATEGCTENRVRRHRGIKNAHFANGQLTDVPTEREYSPECYSTAKVRIIFEPCKDSAGFFEKKLQKSPKSPHPRTDEGLHTKKSTETQIRKMIEFFGGFPGLIPAGIQEADNRWTRLPSACRRSALTGGWRKPFPA